MSIKLKRRACAGARASALSAAVLGAGLVFAPPPPAEAKDWIDTMMDWNPYVGSDLMRTSYIYKHGNAQRDGVTVSGGNGKVLGETQYGIDLHGGFTPHENFGFEAGVFYNFGNEKTVSAGSKVANLRSAPFNGPLIAAQDSKVKMSSWGLTLDAMGYYAPLNNGNKNFKLIGTGGVTWTKISAKGNIEVFNPGGGANIAVPMTAGGAEFGFRIGGGMQFGMTENTNLRTLIRYQTADLNGAAKGAWNYTMGVNYEF